MSLIIATCIWDVNKFSLPGSRCYNETWVEKLAAGFRRNLSIPHQFVVFTDRPRRFSKWIEQEFLSTTTPNYGSFTEPYRLNQAMILAGLDTVVVGNIDHMALYCQSAPKPALPRNPYVPDEVINPVAFVPAGHRFIWADWDGVENDMVWMRKQETVFTDDLWPGEILSLKAHKVRDLGLQGARIIYMHGNHKPHQLTHLPWIREHWRV